MSSSRDIDAFLASLDYSSAWENAEAYIAKQLDLDLDKGEHLGDDWVLTPDDNILSGCRQFVGSNSEPVVLEVLVAALRSSYHLQPVHDLLRKIADSAAASWRAGDRQNPNRDLLRRVSQAYPFGVQADDLDFVLAMCAEPTMAPQNEADGEDLRVYWFDSLAKLKDPGVGTFCRDLLGDDVGRWADFRLINAMRIIAKSWEPGDALVFSRIAAEHPDSWIRQNAQRIAKRHA